MADFGTYADLTDFKASITETGTTLDAHLLGVLEDCSRWIDGHCKRHFLVKTETYTFSPVRHDRLLLPFDLLSIATLKTDEDSDYDYDYVWATSDYWLEPANTWPKWELVVKPLGAYSFPIGRNAVQIAGQWGYGSGDTATPYRDSGATVTVATTTGTTVTASSGAAFAIGQTILAGNESMYITNISGTPANNLTVVRGVNGTTAATQAAATAYIWEYPRNVRRACLLLANRSFQLETAPLGVRGSAEMGVVEVAASQLPEIYKWLDPFKLVTVG